METFKGKIIGHTTKSDIKDLLKDMNLSDIKIKPTIIDVSLMYKMKYPKENKISLKNIVQHIFEYEISKFEQCSCWS